MANLCILVVEPRRLTRNGAQKLMSLKIFNKIQNQMKQKRPPLPKWLLQHAKDSRLKIQQSPKKLDDVLLDGWFLSTSANYKIFGVAEHHRELAGAKYLSPSGEGLPPILILPNLGLVNKNKMDDSILQQLGMEGLNLVEGVQGALALGASG